MTYTQYPYRGKGPNLRTSIPTKLEATGADNKIPRHAWITSGPLTRIERGPPISQTMPDTVESFRDPSKRSEMQRFVDVMAQKKYLKEYNKMYKSLAAQQPGMDITDPDLMCLGEKQLIFQYQTDQGQSTDKDANLVVFSHDGKSTSELPIGIHLHTWGGRIAHHHSQIFDDPKMPFGGFDRKPKKIRTGLAQYPPERQRFREVHFAGLTDEDKKKGECHDSATKPLELYQGSFKTRVALREKSTIGDDIVQECMDRFFDPHVGIPFVPRDIARYFPLEILIKPEKVVLAPYEAVLAEVEPTESNEPTLVDATTDDLLFTKNKAPFTRNEVAELRSYHRKFLDAKFHLISENKEDLGKRVKLIKEAFHSKTVFDTYLQLVEEERLRISSGTLGECVFKNKSIWEVAWEKAPKDYASIRIRRDFWWRFCFFVREVTLLENKYEKVIVRRIREMLMTRHEILESLFWDLVKELDIECFITAPVLRLLDFIRQFVKVSSEEFSEFIKKKDLTDLFYQQVVDANEVVENHRILNLYLNEPIEIPEFD